MDFPTFTTRYFNQRGQAKFNFTFKDKYGIEVNVQPCINYDPEDIVEFYKLFNGE
jgi:hypothetical protein